MFCPQCESEYREGFTMCSDCEVPLVRELGAGGDDEEDALLVPMAHSLGAELLGRVIDRFESEGVPYVVETGTALSLLMEGAKPLSEPEPWTSLLSVAAGFEQRAKEILEEEGRAARE